jgi:hypothetical protein
VVVRAYRQLVLSSIIEGKGLLDQHAPTLSRQFEVCIGVLFRRLQPWETYATGRVFHDADSHVMNFEEMMGAA